MDPFFSKSEELNEAEILKEKRAVLEGVQKQKPDADGTPKKKRVRWMTRSMAEDFSRQDVLRTTLRDAIIYLIFIVAVSIHSMGKRNSSMFYMTKALKGQFLNVKFENALETDITFKEIHTASDFWAYANQVLVESLYVRRIQNPYAIGAKVDEEDNRILFENKLLGVPRLRQVRVKNDSCTVHKLFSKSFKKCYALYSEENENQASFGLGNGTAWEYSPPNVTRSIQYEGTIATYGGGGFYQEFGTNKNKTKHILDYLKKSLWIRRGTRAVFVDFSLFNANLNLFCICKLIFEFLPTGGVRPSSIFQTIKLLPYVDLWDAIVHWFVYLMYIMTVYYILEEFRELIYFKCRYFGQFWTYIDLTVIASIVGKGLLIKVFRPSSFKAVERIKKNPNAYGNLEEVGAAKFVRINFDALILFFAYIKLFKYINFNKTMGQLNNTLKRCAFDLLGFSIMFFIIFFAYAEMGYFVFGTHVEDFRSFGVAMFTLLRTILGDFDYDAIERANGIWAPAYFLSYIFLVFFVLLNMFLAIINDTYADVKTEIAITPDEMQMAEYVKRGFLKLLRKCGCKIKSKYDEEGENDTTQDKIREALRKCGFSDLEIEMFFARYNIDPLAEVGDYDVKKIMKDLDEQAFVKSKLDEDTELINIEDFLKQQERVTQMESIIVGLKEHIQNLIEKMNAFETARKAKAANTVV